MEIKIKNLTKKIGGVNILKDINMNFDSGKVHLIIGPNGAGKTSLLRLLSLLDSPLVGEIFYDGVSSRSLTSRSRTNVRRALGFVFQNPVMLSSDVYDNAVCGLKFRGIEPKRDEIVSVLSKFGLSKKINLMASELSGGEKQRLSFARVWLLNPAVYILDEPTSHLDPVSQKVIEDTVSELSELEKTLIIATHNLRQARRFNGEIFFIKNGEVIQSGAAEEIFNHPSAVEIAEYCAAENIIYGDVIKDENGYDYLKSGDLKIRVVAGDISGPAAGILKAEEILVSIKPIASSARNSFSGKIKKN